MSTTIAKRSFLVGMRRARSIQALAVAVLGTMVGAQLLTTWHELTVRHVACADHGEMTHVRVAEAPPSAPASRPAPLAGGHAASTQNPWTAEGHEHCALVMAVRRGTSAPAAWAAPRQSPLIPAASPPDRSAPGPTRAVILGSAPKTSPPIV